MVTKKKTKRKYRSRHKRTKKAGSKSIDNRLILPVDNPDKPEIEYIPPDYVGNILFNDIQRLDNFLSILSNSTVEEISSI
jgi:hypothetical protein